MIDDNCILEAAERLVESQEHKEVKKKLLYFDQSRLDPSSTALRMGSHRGTESKKYVYGVKKKETPSSVS